MRNKVYLLLTILFTCSTESFCAQEPNTSQSIITTLWNKFQNIINVMRPTEEQTTNLLKRKTPYSQLPLQLTKPTSQRENWSAGFIAEPIATVTNLGFLVSALRHKDTAPESAKALAAAGIVSALSHAMPYNILNIADHVAAGYAVGRVIYDTKLYKPENLIKTLKNPMVAGLLATTGLLYGVDVYIPRSGMERQDWHKYIHGAWHLVSALLADTALTLNPANTSDGN